NPETHKKALYTFPLQQYVKALLFEWGHILQRVDDLREQVRRCRFSIEGRGFSQLVNCLTVTNGRKIHNVLFDSRINMNQPGASAFHTVNALCFPSFLAYPAVYGLPGDTQTISQLFRGHFTA